MRSRNGHKYGWVRLHKDKPRWQLPAGCKAVRSMSADSSVAARSAHLPSKAQRRAPVVLDAGALEEAMGSQGGPLLLGVERQVHAGHLHPLCRHTTCRLSG